MYNLRLVKHDTLVWQSDKAAAIDKEILKTEDEMSND
jgi:hypothetical protein